MLPSGRGCAVKATSNQHSILTGPALDASTLMCTYGTETNTTTMFPEDGVCDLIFFDSAYKKYINVPTQPQTFGTGMKSFLAAASRYESTEFGVAFAYLYIDRLTADVKRTNPTMLEVFWRSGVFHFGIIDMPASGVSHDNIRGVFTLLKTDAVSALQRIQETGASTKLLVSFSMKGRWTVVKPNFPLELSSECYADQSAKPFGTYVGMCQLKSQNDRLKFGIAIYDLEYDDYNNSCSDLNIYGAFSRLKMVRKVVEHFRSSLAGSGGCEYDVPCPSGASA
ncbi:hypothetical protein V5799_022429 [Amblyomma americanum]|uniref:Uncharacterized protein n=1 Tax=Amblyomma americanum TaxID=6943 RepID=A0AAQ4FKJ8_AMBAM